MIAATRATSTRSTPTPSALTRSEPQAGGQPRGRGQVSAEDQTQPHERRGERRPQRYQGHERRPPARDRLELGGPATPLLGDGVLEREPRGLEPPRGSPDGVLPLRVRGL